MSEPTTVFPTLSPSYILTFQFSSWYPTFANHSIKSTIVRPLSDDFQDYLNADGVFIPEGSEIESTDDEDGDEDEEPPQKRYAFLELDKRIRDCILEYDAVFPKLNFSCPKVRSFFFFYFSFLFPYKPLAGRIMASPSFFSSQMYLTSRCLSLTQILRFYQS
jgi:D123